MANDFSHLCNHFDQIPYTGVLRVGKNKNNVRFEFQRRGSKMALNFFVRIFPLRSKQVSGGLKFHLSLSFTIRDNENIKSHTFLYLFFDFAENW